MRHYWYLFVLVFGFCVAIAYGESSVRIPLETIEVSDEQSAACMTLFGRTCAENFAIYVSQWVVDANAMKAKKRGEVVDALDPALRSVIDDAVAAKAAAEAAAATPAPEEVIP